MNKKAVIIVVIAVVAVVAVYLAVSSSNPNVTQNAPAPAPVAPVSDNSAVPAPLSVVIKNFAFSPSSLNVKVGTSVMWTNDDAVTHTITSDSGSLLNSGMLSPGQSFSFTFDRAGSFGYHCNIHPAMKGTVVVK